MADAAHFLFLLALLAGLVVFVWSLQLYQQHRHDFLRANLLAMGGFNLISFLNVATTYYRATRGEGGGSVAEWLFHRLPLVAFPLLLVLTTTCFVEMVAAVRGKPLHRNSRIAVTALALVIMAIQALFAVRWSYFSQSALPGLVMVWVELGSLVAIWWALFRLFRSTDALPVGSRRRALRRFSRLLLVPVSLLLTLSLGRLLGVFHGPALLLAGAALGAAILVIVLVFFQQFLPIHLEDVRVQMGGGSELDALFQQFGISNRERDVIRLICEGKPNKEIAAELYITLQTVKDHVSRIFVKVGVSNRVQLTRIFLR